MLDKYSLDEFKPLVEGLRKGDLRTFQDGLVNSQHLFIRYVLCAGELSKFIFCLLCTIMSFLSPNVAPMWLISQGTYLLLEKCKTVCYRNLFKRIHKILDKHQISLNHVAKALKWLGMPIDLDEVECILANLIYRGYVRGYLSHAKRVLVLSKRDPFPTASVILK